MPTTFRESILLEYLDMMATSIREPTRMDFSLSDKIMLDSIINLLEVQKAGIQTALGDACRVDEAAGGKEVMEWRLPAPKACYGVRLRS